jgi:tetratricopeptide (TPR) repeat protein
VKTQKYQEAVDVAEDFQGRYPYSLRLQKVRFLKGQALEELDRWTEAADNYRIISEFSEKNQPEISAMSIYRLSFVYEALGDDQRVLTTLFEAQKNGKYLPTETALAEIPSRIAMVYAKENNPKEANRWLAEADKGLKKTLETRNLPLTDEWLAEIYYNMGSISTNQLSNDNIITIIQGQKAIQKYLMRSLQYGDPIWSAKAMKKLRMTYVDLWNAIYNLPETSGMEPTVAKKIKTDEQFKLVSPFAELLADAQLYRPGREQKSNPYQDDFFAFLDQMQVNVSGLMQNPLYTPLTTGRDKSPQKAKLPAKIDASSD